MKSTLRARSVPHVCVLIACCLFSVSMLLGGCVDKNGNLAMVPLMTNSTSAKQVEENKAVVVPDASATAFEACNVRKQASTQSPVVFRLAQDQQVLLTGQSGDWYVIKTEQGEGFVYRTLLGVNLSPGESYSTSLLAGKKLYKEASHKTAVLGVTGQEACGEVLGREGKYYKVSYGETTGYVFHKNLVINVDSRSVPEQKAGPGNVAKVQEVLTSYAEKNASVRDNFALGKYDEVAAELDERYGAEDNLADIPEHANEMDLLPAIERGYLEFEMSRYKESVAYFSGAEQTLTDRENRSSSGSFAMGCFSGLATMVGFEEVTPYDGPGFEKVLMLNYKALAYLMNGERKAYNVTRRAIEIQGQEREAFAKQIEEAQAKLEKEKKEAAEKQAKEIEAQNVAGNGTQQGDKKAQGVDFAKLDFSKVLLLNSASQVKRAKTVPSAFVNPFGDYLNAAILEIDGYEDSGQRSAAKIAYEKAAQLQPKCSVLAKAAKDMDKSPKGRLVHVIVADGFGPEKTIQTTGIPISSLPVIVKSAVYKSVPSDVAFAEVAYGKTNTRLELLADLEALALRYEADALPMNSAKIFTNILRSYFERQMLSNAAGGFGEIAGALHDAMSKPDSRSWLTMPCTISVQRLMLPENVSSLTLRTRSAKNKVLNTVTINLPANGPCIVYARSMNENLTAHVSKGSWL